MTTETDRLAALRNLDILDTKPEAAFDEVVAMARRICGAPIALVSLVDQNRQWFKARAGIGATETPRDTSVCAIVIEQTDLLVIPNLTQDSRTAAMSLVLDAPNLRFYAGAPLVTDSGIALGSLCVIDTVPRPQGLTGVQADALRALAKQVTAQIELRGAIGTQGRRELEQALREDRAARDGAVLDAMRDAQQCVVDAEGDTDTMLQALVAAALTAVEPADGIVIELQDDDSLVYRAAAGSAVGHVGMEVPVGDSFSGATLLQSATLVTADAFADPRTNAAAVRKIGIRSMIAVPLIRKGAAFGVLKVHAAATDAFRSRHVLIAQMLAGFVAASFTESAEAQALRSAAQNEERFRTIIDSAIDSAIVSTDDDGIITSWSKGGERIFGWTENEMVGEPLKRIFTPEDIAAERPRYELDTARREGRASDERWHMRKDGSRFFAHGAVTPLLGPGQSGFVKSLRDITEEHVARQRLDAARLRLDTALDTGLIGFFSWDVQAESISGDPRLANFFGFTWEEMAEGVALARIFERIASEDRDRILSSVEQSMASLDDYTKSFAIEGDDGKTRWLMLHGRCADSSDGTPHTYVGTAVDMTEQRNTETALRASRERLELATRAAGLGSFDFYPLTGALTWDDRCRALFGLPPGAPISYEGSFLAGLHPDDRETTDAAIAKALDPSGNGRFRTDYRTIGLQDGVERMLAAEGLALFERGVAVRLIGTVRDVTADRAASAELRETAERLRYAVMATNDAVWDWDLRVDTVLWNDALQRAFGYPPEDVATTGAWWLEHIHPDDRGRIDHSIHALIDSRSTEWLEEYRFRRADGSHADVLDRGFVIREADGRPIRMIGAMLDLTDRKRIERELQSRADRLEVDVATASAERDRLWDASPDLLMVLDLNGVIQQANGAWTVILGLDPERLVGTSLVDLIATEDRAAMNAALAAAADGPMPTIETRMPHDDEGYRWVSWVAAAADNRIYATGRHITAEKEAAETLRQTEDALRQSQKVEAVGQLTGGVAHDFNNLLTVIRGSIDLLKRPDLAPEKRARYIEAISDTTDRATKLTAQLLAFARRQTLQPQVFDAGESVRALGDMLGTLSGSRIRLSIEGCIDDCFVNADPSQFDTAIVNMAVNARDAMQGEGDLRITVEAADEMPGVRNHPPVHRPFVKVTIADTGSGIPPEKLGHIFEPFFTTKAVGQGTGLGLSQVFGFTKQSEGGIFVSSVVGEGTRFDLYLPRVDADLAIGDVATDRLQHPLTPGSCVLVVEDNEEVGRFATQALAELGYSSVWAANADEALSQLRIDAARFDVVFTDVIMPGKSGIELAEEIRDTWPTLPIVMTSGYSEVLAQQGTGGYALLQKPYSIERLSRFLAAPLIA